jgi:nickel-dependent lactate racemase
VLIEGHGVAVKIAHRGGVIVQVTPEFDDVAALSDRQNRPTKDVLNEAAVASAAQGLIVGGTVPQTAQQQNPPDGKDNLEMTSTLPTRAASNTSLIGGPDTVLTESAVREFVTAQLAGEDLDGRSVCVIIPDGTRSCPLPLLMSAVHAALHGRASRITVLVALGTHAAMNDSQLAKHLGYPEGDLASVFPGVDVINHEWWRPEAMTSLGSIDADRVRELSDGRMAQPVEVVLNRAVVDHDVALVVGPVFPHEVV